MNSSQNKLGEMPIGKLLVSMSVPMMISMLIQSLYNIVDGIFVAKLTEDALTAVSLAFPLQGVMTAVAVGTGIGVNALVSRSLGEGNPRRAEKAANVQVFLGVVYAAVTAVIGIFFSRSFFSFQTDVEPIIEYGQQYLFIVCVFSLGLYFSQGFEKLLVGTGNSTPSMLSQAAGAVINIVLDPVLIFGLGPVPALGVRGAAIATVIGQFAAAIIAYAFNLKCNQATRFHITQMLPDMKILKFIFSVGFPSMVTIGLNSLMGYGMNAVFLRFSTTAAAVYGIWVKLQSFGFMPVFGMNNGTIAIFSFNYGAKKHDRVIGTFRLSLTVGVIVTALVAAFYIIAPVPLLEMFSASPYMTEIGVPALRITAISMAFGAANVIVSSFCQALGHAKFTLFFNLLRQCILQLPIAFALSLFGRLNIVWFAPLIAELLAMGTGVYMVKKIFSKLRAQQRELS